MITNVVWLTSLSTWHSMVQSISLTQRSSSSPVHLVWSSVVTWMLTPVSTRRSIVSATCQQLVRQHSTLVCWFLRTGQTAWHLQTRRLIRSVALFIRSGNCAVHRWCESMMTFYLSSILTQSMVIVCQLVWWVLLTSFLIRTSATTIRSGIVQITSVSSL